MVKNGKASHGNRHRFLRNGGDGGREVDAAVWPYPTRNAILQILCSHPLQSSGRVRKHMVRPCVVSSEIGTCTLATTLILLHEHGIGVLALQVDCCLYVHSGWGAMTSERRSLQKIPSAECSAAIKPDGSALCTSRTIGRATEFSDCLRPAALCRMLNRLMRAR